MIKKCGYGSCAVGVDNFARKRSGRHANLASNWAPRYIPIYPGIGRVYSNPKYWPSQPLKSQHLLRYCSAEQTIK
jgi:hypothetical protein